MRQLSTRKIVKPLRPYAVTQSNEDWLAEYDAEYARLQALGFHPERGACPVRSLLADASPSKTERGGAL
jgi:hypothetical protein